MASSSTSDTGATESIPDYSKSSGQGLMNLFLDRIIILLLLRLIVSCDDKYLFESLVEFAQEEMTMEVIIYMLHTPMGTYLLLPQSPDSPLRQQCKKIDDQEWTK